MDGIDGPLSRKFNIAESKVKIDGVLLDLVVDYLTYVFIPAIFLWKFEMLPSSSSLVFVGLILFSSALYFSRTDMKSGDYWFLGFPASWNFVIFSMYLLGTSTVFNAVCVVVFVGLSATNIETIHIFRSKQLRKITILLTFIYFGAMLSMVLLDEVRSSVVGKAIIIGWFIYYFSSAIWKTWIYQNDRANTLS